MGLHCPFKTEGLSELQRINPAPFLHGRLLDWLSWLPFHPPIGEVIKLKITFFKGLQREGVGCKLGWANKMPLRKPHYFVGVGEAEAAFLVPVDRKQVWADRSMAVARPVFQCLVTSLEGWEVVVLEAASIASWPQCSNLESIIQQRPPTATPPDSRNASVSTYSLCEVPSRLNHVGWFLLSPQKSE